MLIIHIGMPKTGSSYLQSIAAKNRDELSNMGIIYPHGRNDYAALAGNISSGNGDVLKILSPKKDTTNLLSNELFFLDFEKTIAHIKNAIKSGIPVRLVMLTRDLLPLLCSMWQQTIKRGGLHNVDIDHYLEAHARTWLAMILRWIHWCSANNVPLKTLNYSKVKNELAQNFFKECVGLKNIGSLQFYDEQPVNRSLTRSEIVLQQIANEYFGKASSAQVSDVLVNQCPTVKADIIRPSTEVALRVHDYTRPLLNRINHYLPRTQQLAFDGENVMQLGRELSPDEPLIFSRSQLTALLSGLQKHDKSTSSQ